MSLIQRVIFRTLIVFLFGVAVCTLIGVPLGIISAVFGWGLIEKFDATIQGGLFLFVFIMAVGGVSVALRGVNFKKYESSGRG
jgi:ABC-type dipeptide/oligopeptide/nickel transport system permease component